jgi:hypothetical protein
MDEQQPAQAPGQAAPVAIKFSSHAEFEAQLRECIGRARGTLQMFDPDFAVFHLGSIEIDALLRKFLHDGGQLMMVMHSTRELERNAPRFLMMLRDYTHRMEVRVSSRSLHHLTDSFCIADHRHIVRRFHSDHIRGEAAFDDPHACDVSSERFTGIFAESQPGLHAATTGL